MLKLNFKLDDFDKQYINSNTTLVKVKYNYRVYKKDSDRKIQIQHLLKLNINGKDTEVPIGL